MQQRGMRRNISFLMRFIFMLLTLIAIYSIVFHYIMEYEGRSYSWVTGVYWTLTVMSTLGFGDITFTSDLGRLFSIVVLLSGVLLLLIMLPFTFIQFFYAPWLEVQKKGHTRPPEVCRTSCRTMLRSSSGIISPITRRRAATIPVR